MKRILRHVGGKDFKKTHQRKLDEQRVLYLERREKEIQEQQRIEEIKRLSSPFKSDWRSEIDSNKMDEINEGMTTSALLSTILPATGDTDLITTEITSADVFADGPYELNLSRGEGGTYPALVGTSVKSSGSGTGSDGGFDVGSHVAFDGAGSTDGARWAIFQPVDSTSYDKMVFSVIRGNGSNGGEAPDDASGEGLYLYYKMPDMQDYIAIDSYPTVNDIRDEISDFTIVPVGNDTAGIQEYEVDIPSYARGPGARFLVYQFSSNDSQGDNYGITKVAFRRRTPLNVFVSLDSPEATNFIRTDPIMRGLSAEGRRKKLEDMLDAGDEYLLKQLGMQGSIARPADTFAQRDWTASAYGLPTDYKERLVKANAYLQKNVGSTSVSLGLYGGNNVADIRKQSLKTVGFTDRQIDAIEKNNLLQISKTSGVSKKSDSSKTAAPTTSNTSSTSGPYGLPADYKERLIKANAYYQKNVGSIPVSLGLHSGSSNYDRSEELRRKSFKEVGFTDAQIDTIERNNLLQTKFEPSKKMSGVKSSRPTYDPNYSWNRTNVNVDPETFQKLAAQQIAQSRQKQQQVSNNVATSKATSDKSGYMDIQVGDQRITRSYDAAGNYTGADTGWQPDTEYSKQVADEISKAVAAARAEYLKSGQTVAQRQQSLEKLQAAIKAGTDYASGQKGFKLPGFGADSKPTASAASDNVTSFLDKMGQVFGGVKDSVVKVSSGIGDGFAVLDDVKKAIQSAEKTGKLIPPSPGSDRPTITPGERGSKENPVQRTLSPSTNKTLTSGINRNMTGKVLRTIIQNNINTDFNFGAKGTINNLTSDPYFNEKGDLVIDDTYAFDPGGDVDKKPFLFGGTTGDFAKSASAALVGSGGEYEKNRVELEKDILTKFDQSIGAVLPDTPGRKDPIIHMRIVIPASQIKESFERKVISEKKLKSPKQVLNNKIPGYYDGKPAPLGFPDNPPPEMVNGMHPDLVDGKNVANRFNRLDPQSAQAMPLTGNPHIDKKVLKARKQPK